MPRPLAEIVLEEGLADRAMVAAAAERADRERVPLVVALVRGGAVDELALVAAIRRHVRVLVTDPAAVALDYDALREVPREVCQRQRVLPLSLQVFEVGPRLLRVAMADPTDAVAVAEVEHLTTCEVEATLMPLSAVEELVDTAYRSFVTQVIKRDRDAAFGADLAVTTPAQPGDLDLPAGRSTTAPYHRISDEADLALRHRALLRLLVRLRVVSEDEYEEEVRALLKGREGGG